MTSPDRDIQVSADEGPRRLMEGNARFLRVEKYNQLLRIDEELGAAAMSAGRGAFVR